MTLVSVLQGVAFGALLLNIPLPAGGSWSVIFHFLLGHYFYLPYIISSLIIIMIWTQFVGVNMFLFWPLSRLQTILVFLLTLCEIIAFRNIEILSVWIACLGAVAIVGGWIAQRNFLFMTKDMFEAIPSLEKTFEYFQKSNRKTVKLYFGLGAFTMLLGLAYNWLVTIIMSRVPQLASLVSWGIILSLFITLIILLQRDIDYRRGWLNQVIEGSDLVPSPHGGIKYITAKDDAILKKEYEELSKEPSSASPRPIRLVSIILLNTALISFFAWVIHRITTGMMRKTDI